MSPTPSNAGSAKPAPQPITSTAEAENLVRSQLGTRGLPASRSRRLARSSANAWLRAGARYKPEVLGSLFKRVREKAGLKGS